jgi:hypothetical protein
MRSEPRFEDVALHEHALADAPGRERLPACMREKDASRER